ncbi:hypothetical protein L1049_019651 [Liquidambar formosana]|uniref:CCT domain-containing protein n=1 Tax=Liquidambar formosana TaxID=63359 RepID=A0AAP0S6Y8_LIQFO
MYAETGLLFPYLQSFSQEVQQLEDYCRSQKTNASMNNLVQTSTICEYDMGELFKAPEPIIEEPAVGLDPLTATISMISCGDDVISPQALEAADIESIQNEQLWSDVFYECKKDLLAKAAMDNTVPDVLDVKVPVARVDENQIAADKFLSEGALQKSVSLGCLSSTEWINGIAMRSNFLDFPGIDFGSAYGMRRAFSEGDIKTLGNGMSLIHSPHEQQPVIINNCTTEERKQKLSRYRNKKTKRNFGRKIKYACRKALADSQPRIRGRFAKTDESDISKKQ